MSKKSASDYKEINQIIGQGLRELRKTKNIRGEDLCEYLGISNYQLYKYETGQNRIRLDMFSEVANFLDIDIVELLQLIMGCSSNSNLNLNEQANETKELLILWEQIDNKKTKQALLEMLKSMICD